MTKFELYYRKFGGLKKRHQLSTIFNYIIEGEFETLEISDVDILTAHYMIEPIFKWNFGNTFQHHNGPNQRQHIHKKTSQQYQPISYQIPRTSSITYLKGCGLKNKVTMELSIRHYGKLETCLFRGPFFHKEKVSHRTAPSEQ